MNRIISDNQSAFIKGRLISDNVLIAHEYMHFLKNKKFGDWDLALKLDMSKAYDKVEWCFLWKVMSQLGFCDQWIGWMKECVTTVSYSVTVDGQPKDDSIIFSKANSQACQNIMQVLNDYNSISGQEGWRLMTRPNSLVTKVFRSRYFRHSSFLKADIGYNPSWAWRSLLEGRKVLEKGIFWQIGRRSAVKIWEDCWVGRQGPLTLRQNQEPNPSLIWVSQLITEEGNWNEHLIANNFTSEITQEILQINIKEEDNLIWYREKGGSYSVRSGYEVCFNFFHPPLESLPPIFADKNLWNSIWDLDCPAKVKVFTWKALHNGFPVRHQLHARIQAVPAICPRCEMEDETLTHCLLNCIYSRQVWNHMGFLFNSPNRVDAEDSFVNWWREMQVKIKQESFNKKQRSLLAMVLWRIWISRNNWLFDGKRSEPAGIWEEAHNMNEEFHLKTSHC
ncbi:uncharacterized protein LOC130975593 [Arachis stenosperma]|uniref:uncharacterized protein LOC130975593 n=1 Tax=Arachis stenosperma TaxID=217475 RepID=UPI0025ACCC8B|nr:uncharacterized protein LOC130975593 [Arachis stenosperma]